MSWTRREAAEGSSRLIAAIVAHGTMPSSVRRLRLRPGCNGAGGSPKGCLTPTADSVLGARLDRPGVRCSLGAHERRSERVVRWLLWLTRTFAPKIDPAFPRRAARNSARADQSTPSADDHHALANSANRRDSEQERPLVHHAHPRRSLGATPCRPPEHTALRFSGRATGGLFLHHILGPGFLGDELPYLGGRARPALGME